MRISVTVSIWLTPAILHLVSMTLLEDDDLELSGQGLYLDFSGSGSGFGPGSGDWSEQEELEDDQILPIDKKVRLTPVHAEPGSDDSSDSAEFDFESPWPTEGGEILVVANSKNLMDREEVFAAIVAGAVAGVVLAATLGTVLIYKWHMKSAVSYTPGQQRAPSTY